MILALIGAQRSDCGDKGDARQYDERRDDGEKDFALREGGMPDR